MIPYVDLIAQNEALEDEILAAVRTVLRHGWFILGPEVEQLESELAALCDVPHVVGVASGTDALVLALQAMGIGPGHEVITVSHSFVASATAIVQVGAVPVFVDIDADSLLMDANQLQGALTDRTRAVIPVHLAGRPCDLDAIGRFCRDNGLQLLEDCAQAIGARYRGRSVGSFGVGAFSLHPLKNLAACGDAGFVTCTDGDLAARIRVLRNLGLRDRDHCVASSRNARLDTLHAAILLVKLPYLEAWNAARRAHAAAYRQAFGGRLRLPPDPPEHFAVYSGFVVRHRARDQFVKALVSRGVDAKIHYPLAIHQQPVFADMKVSLPRTEAAVSEIFSLPVSPELSVIAREQVIEAVLQCLGELGDDPRATEAH
jgi:dTDP-4-amino-4,6-dideoxygalactose transaminase